ncbi:MAG TPA: type II toxin-antitoxin system VapC family toxin [Thermoanaerobaculia bacterium]|nr:type II toxin-antitoxin system VapC family toxin [Thermoanaerobaculia bacterium]
MLLIDVNVLVYAFREDAPRHDEYRGWLLKTIDSGKPFGVADIVLSGFLRITTHPSIFKPASPILEALRFAEALRSQPNCVSLTPGARHWGIFTHLCRATAPRGNDIPDTFLAALAIEAEAEWITADGGFSRFPDLRWRHPLR